MLVQTGLRRSECASVCVGDMTVSKRAGQVVVRHGKDKLTRSVPVNASVRQALAEYLGPRWGCDSHVNAIARVWTERPRREAIWLGQRGPLNSAALQQIIKPLIKRCDLHGLLPAEASVHPLRHTFAMGYLATHPGDPIGVATLLGHATLDT